MLQSFKIIRNVGKFDSFNWNIRENLAKFTVIYGENGRGKTTLAAILRSLADGDASIICNRHRLGSEHPPHVVIQISDKTYIFQANVWKDQYQQIAVFDDSFVAQNVCSDIEVENTHCKNLQ